MDSPYNSSPPSNPASRSVVVLGSVTLAQLLALTPNSGNVYSVLDASSSGIPVLFSGNGTDWIPQSFMTADRACARVFTDLMNIPDGGFASSASGTGSGSQVVTTGNIPSGSEWAGIAEISTGTTTTGRGGLSTAAAVFNFANGVCIYRQVLSLSALSNVTDRYTHGCGFTNNLPATATNAAWFTYTDNANSGKWLCQTIAGGVASTADSGITVAAKTEYDLMVRVAAGVATFFINGAQVAQINTNVPTGYAQIMGVQCHMVKSAGTTAVAWDCDKIEGLQLFSAVRA